VVKEAQFLLTLDHENIVNIDTVFWIKKKIIVFTEYIGGGELKDYILSQKVPCSEVQTRKIARSIMSAVFYIHSNKVVHRDLKLENILMVEKGNPYSLKIIDFGISGVLNKVGKEDVINAGTMMYSPPEIISKTNLQSSPKIDVWSLGIQYFSYIGVIIYILLTKEYPF